VYQPRGAALCLTTDLRTKEHRMPRALTVLAALVSALLLALGLASRASAEAPKATTLEKVSSIAQPGIVYMETSYSGVVWDPVIKDYIGGSQTPQEFEAVAGSCSGFFVNPDGYFVSAGHCVEYDEAVKEQLIQQAVEWSYQNEPWPDDWTLEDAQAFAAKYWKVRSADRPQRSRPDRRVAAAYGVDIGGLPTGKALPARLLGFRVFEQGDVALLKLEAEDVPVLQLAPEAAIEVGTEIVSVGYPGSVDLVTDATFDPSFKEGSVSSKRTIGSGLLEVYEVSAAVSGGMSGGPTVDRQGRVVGVNSFGIVGETQPFNFVTPASEVAQLMSDKGVKNQLGHTNRLYLQGLKAYYAGDREEALANLNELLDQVREHELAQKFRAKALRLPKEESSGLPVAIIGLGLGIAAVLAGVAILLRRRRRGPAAPAGPLAPRPQTPPMTGVAVSGNGGNGNGGAAIGNGAPSQAPSKATTLVVLAGPLAGRRIPLDSAMVLGRATIDDEQVSGQHAALRPTGGGVEVTDLGSQAGTMVNGARIAGSAHVANGDMITLGSTTIMVERPKTNGATETHTGSPH
jgi:serine protease Do